jgi:hypothetical protein
MFLMGSHGLVFASWKKWTCTFEHADDQVLSPEEEKEFFATRPLKFQ